VAVFLAKSMKHSFLNEISCAQNLSQSSSISRYGWVIYLGFKEKLFYKEILGGGVSLASG